MKNKSCQNLEKGWRSNSGVALILAIILVGVMAMLLLVIVTLTLLGLNVSKQGTRQLSALDVAEAGTNYYLWHLVHSPDDYCDGNPCIGAPPYGPYVHNYTDNTGKVIGTYTVWVAPPESTEGGKVVICHVPPPVDETLTVAPSAVAAHLAHGDSLGSCEGGGESSGTVVVESRGDVVDGNENRTIVATLGIPSFAQYAVVANDTTNHIRFGEGTEVFGPIHNNGGVRFDGVAHGLVTSALADYNDPDHSGPNEPGVHTHRPDPAPVFLGGTSFPVPPVDFNQVTADLADIKEKAQPPDGLYYGPSGASGYHIVLQTAPIHSFDIYRVNSTTGSCWTGNQYKWQDKNTMNSQTKIGNDVLFPNNGIIFVEDNLWIDGQIEDAQLTIAAATLPE